jgi:AraC-like DNA-binding protein
VELVLSPQRRVHILGEGEHWHYHEAFELTYFESGEGTRFVGDQIQQFQHGDLVLLGANLPHYWHTRSQSKGWAVQWHYPPTHHFWAIPETGMLGPFFKSAARGIQFRGHTAEILSGQLQQLADTNGLDRFGLLLRLFAIAATAPACDRDFIYVNSFSLSAVSRHQISMQAAIGFLLANFRKEIRLTEILEVAKMSRSTFERQFKKHSGKTLSDFLQQIRLDAACRELARTDNPIIDVAFGNGFTQVSFFNRVFRRSLKCSPSDYRCRCRTLKGTRSA